MFEFVSGYPNVQFGIARHNALCLKLFWDLRQLFHNDGLNYCANRSRTCYKHNCFPERYYTIIPSLCRGSKQLNRIRVQSRTTIKSAKIMLMFCFRYYL